MKLFKRDRGEPEPVPDATVHFEFADAPGPAEPEIDDERWKVEMAVPLSQISALFASRGWALARPGKGTQPSPTELAELLTELVNAVSEQPGGSYCPLARFLAVHDTEFPDDVDLYLHIGTATNQNPTDTEGEDFPVV